MERFDLIICGAGPAGAALASALTPWLRRIALVDAHAARLEAARVTDHRVLALADSSVRILAGLGLWRQLGPRATAIRQVELATGGNRPGASLDGRQRGLGALGYTLPAAELIAVLHRHLSQRGVNWIAPATLEEVTVGATEVTVHAGDRQLGAPLLVGADGTHSRVREALGIGSHEHDYAQQAIVTRVESTPPGADIAYEVLTPGGPLALLPESAGWALVWVQPQAASEELLALADSDFLVRLQAQLGTSVRLTALKGPRSSYPLKQLSAWTLTAERTALIGNAAHTVHPIGAQGFNLGLRDAATLAEGIANAVRAGMDLGDPALLTAYAGRRLADHRRVLAFTDGLARLLDECTPARKNWFGLGLELLQRLPPLRSALVHIGTGGLDAPTRLGRGLSL